MLLKRAILYLDCSDLPPQGHGKAQKLKLYLLASRHSVLAWASDLTSLHL